MDELHTCWIFKKNGDPVRARQDGRPDIRGVDPGRRAWLDSAEGKAHFKRITRMDKKASEKRQAYHRSPKGKADARRRGRLGGLAYARNNKNTGYGDSGWLGHVYCRSACEKRILAYLWYKHPNCEVRGYDAEQDGLLTYERVDGVTTTYTPDLVVIHPDGIKDVYEIKYLENQPYKISAWDVQEAKPQTANDIITKMEAFPWIKLRNGYASEMVELYKFLRARGMLPDWRPDKPSSRDT